MSFKSITTIVISLLIASVLQAATLAGSGSSLAFPLMERFVENYQQNDLTLAYSPVGSFKGVEQLLMKQVDYAVSEISLTELNPEKSAMITEIPLTVGATAIAYNLPGEIKTLKLSPKLIIDMYQGKITNWNDKRIQDLNTHLELPDLPIITIYRSDKSGTTHMLTSFFSAADKKWRRKMGVKMTMNGSTPGIGVRGSSAVAKTITQTEGSIGYVGWHYAKKFSLGTAAIQNARGQFVLPSEDSIHLTLTKEALAKKSLVYPNKDYTYPICGFMWLMIYKDAEVYGNYESAKNIVSFLKWTLREGQLIATSLDYTTLPNGLMSDVQNMVRSVSYEDIILY